MKIYCVNMQKSFFLISDGYSPLYKHIKLWDVVCLKQECQETIIKCVICSLGSVYFCQENVRQRTVLEFACACVWFWMKYVVQCITYLNTLQ